MPYCELERQINNLSPVLSTQKLAKFLKKCVQLKWIESTSQECWHMTGRGKVCFENYHTRDKLRAEYNAQHTAHPIIQIESDGNCFWRCISMQLTGTERSHFALRSIFQVFVQQNAPIIQPLYSTFSEISFGQWSKEIGQRGHYGYNGKFLCILMSIITNIHISVHRLSGHQLYAMYPNTVEGKDQQLTERLQQLGLTDAQKINIVNYTDHYELIMNKSFNCFLLSCFESTEDPNVSQAVSNIYFPQQVFLGLTEMKKQIYCLMKENNERNEMAVIGFVKKQWKLYDIGQNKFPPMYLLKLMHSWYWNNLI